MNVNILSGARALATILLCLYCNAALAQERPAVSGLNGKFEFSAGALTLPTPSFVGRAAGALTVPLGDRFGLQADFSASTGPGFTTSAALHLFSRDPSAFLLGGSVGFIRSPGSVVVAAGPEAELYRDRWTIEAWAGAAMVDPLAPGPTRLGVFALGTLAYYPTDNWRVSVGISSLDGYTAVTAGSEYLLDKFQLPLAATGEVRLGQDGAVRAMVGLRSYFGPDPHKSLIDRQREDDPADLGTALYGAAGHSTLYGDSGAAGGGGRNTSDGNAGDRSEPESGNGSSADGGNSGDPDAAPTWCQSFYWDPALHACYRYDVETDTYPEVHEGDFEP